MADIIKTLRGTYDILPENTAKWHYVEKIIRECCEKYLYQEIRTPIIEYTDLFQRGVGETTDIVQKEMFTFTIHNRENQDNDDKKSFTLRPEGTASTVRAFVNNKLHALPQPTKLYYMGPMFRYERPQAGRNRQFTQFGIEAFGSKHPSIDVDVIAFADQMFKKLGLKNIRLEINSVGCPVCRQKHKQLMMEKLTDIRQDLCNDCNNRFDKNPLRILDCKNTGCQTLTSDAPMLADHLCESCNEHHQAVKKYLQKLQIEFIENPRLVRGLDYYTQTAFEFMEDSIGAMSTICGGGRYDGLVEQLGGQATPGIGFAMGIERLLIALEKQNVNIPIDNSIDLYAISIGEEADLLVTEAIYKLRAYGLKCEKDFLERSMKAQMKQANRFNAKKTLIIGETELLNKQVIIKDMETGAQETILLDEMIEYIVGGNL